MTYGPSGRRQYDIRVISLNGPGHRDVRPLVRPFAMCRGARGTREGGLWTPAGPTGSPKAPAAGPTGPAGGTPRSLEPGAPRDQPWSGWGGPAAPRLVPPDPPVPPRPPRFRP
ncbi:hypothetical protein GCM10010327_26890 [Streptomyces nitrosporeus]|nr:hypothetical protein GCM10010327_26890 [Streptomyces nitrosporeus]